MQAAWSAAQRRLHWAMAALVFVNFLLALVMVALPLSALLAKILTYQLHKSLGLLLIPLCTLCAADRRAGAGFFKRSGGTDWR